MKNAPRASLVRKGLASRTGALAISLGYAVFASVWVLFSDLAVVYLLSDARSIAITHALKGFGLVVVTAGLLYWLLRRLAVRRDADPLPRLDGMSKWMPAAVLLIVVGGTFLAVLDFMHVHERQVAEQLHVLGQAKAWQISTWRDQQVRVSELLASSGPLNRSVRQWLSTGDSDAEQLILERFESVRQMMNLKSLFLIDQGGNSRLGLDESEPIAPRLAETRDHALASGETKSTGIYAIGDSEDAPVYLDIVSPLLPLAEEPDLAVVMRMDVASLRVFSLQDWAETTKTGEVLLLHREGDDLVVVNQARIGGEAGRMVRIPLYSGEEVATAIATGRAAFGDLLRGRDLWGMPVLAVATVVPNSELWLLAKIGQTEVYQVIRAQVLGAFVIMLLVLVGSLTLARLWAQRKELVAAEGLHHEQQQKIRLEREFAREREQRLAIARRYEDLVENARDIILVIDEEGRIVQANQAAAVAYGVDRESLLNRTVEDLCAPESLGEMMGQWRESRDGGCALFETLHQRSDGTLFPVEISSRIVRLDGKRLREAIIRDISVRQAALEQRDRATRLLAMAAKMASIGGWNVDLTTNRATWSDEVCRIHAVSPGTVVAGEDAVGYYAPEWRERITQVFADCARDGQPYDEELEILAADGRRVWVRTVAEAVRDGSGRIVKVQGALQDISERKRAEARLRESEQQLKLFIEHAPAALAMFDRDMCYLATSRRWGEVHGRGELEVPGRSHYEVFPELSDLKRAAHRRALEGEVVRANEDRMDYASGVVQWLRWEVRPWYGTDGQVGGIIIFSEDVSAQHEARLTRAIQNQRAVALLELPRAAEKLSEPEFLRFGQEQTEELTGSRISFIHFVHEDQKTIEPGVWSRWTSQEADTAPEGDYCPVCDGRIWADSLRRREPVVVNDLDAPVQSQRREEGQSGVQRMISVPVIDEGRVAMIAGVGNKSTDYTDLDVETVQLLADQVWRIVQRRRSENELRQRSLAIEQSSDNVLITDLEARIQYVNQAFLHTTGYTREELMGRNPRVLQSGKTPRASFEALWAALTQGQPWKGELYNRRKDGSEYIEFARIAPLRQADGATTHYVAVKEDITERKRLGQELDQYRNHLEELVAQRTKELSEARIRAETATHAKSMFLANMSHEIRTPMNGVLGMVELLARTGLTPEQKDMVATIEDSGRGLTSLIDDILDFSRIETGQMELDPVPTSLRSVVEDLCASMAAVATHQDVDLNCFVDPAMPEQVLADESRVRQMLFKLLGNGVKFSRGTAERRGRVCIRAELLEREPLRVRFRILDNGVGISDAVQKRLFVPFSQAETSTTRRFGGSGLGLVICKRLADLMDGEIAVVSAVGKGSVFSVTLPLPTPARQPDVTLPDVAGVDCLVIESRSYGIATQGALCSMRDLGDYLEHAGARVRFARETDDLDPILAAMDGRVVVVRYIGYDDVADHRDAGDPGKLRHVFITRGRRSRIETGRPISLDAALLGRSRLLQAVSVAAGRSVPDDAATAGDLVAVTAADRVPPGLAEAPTHGRLILVAEDDAINRQIIVKQLAALGYAANIAHNGAEALEMWRAGGYALLLTDLHMPELDGYSLTRHIRRAEEAMEQSGGQSRRIPIVALTANALRGEAERALALGIDTYLTKPLALPALREALEKHLDSGSAVGTGAAAPGFPALESSPGKAEFDVAVLKRLIGDDSETIGGLLADYLESARRISAEIHAAIGSGDSAKVAAAAHKLKSSSRSVGALALGELCQDLEAAGKAGDANSVQRHVEAFHGAMLVVETRIRSYLDGGAG